MEWETDRSLQLRMLLTLALIAVLPLAFTFTMAAAINHVIIPLAESLSETRYSTISFDPLIVFALTLVGLVLAYIKGGDVALGSTDARVVSESEAPELHARVNRLAATADMPVPDVAIAPSPVPNAFATGRTLEDGTVVVTSSLRETLADEELDAVLAHELAHIRNRDAAVMSIAYLLPTFTYVVSTITYKALRVFLRGLGRVRTGGRRDGRAVAVIIVLLVVTAVVTITISAIFWAASLLLFRLLSQYREFAADRGGAAITGDPLALAAALETIDGEMEALPDQDLRDLDGGAEALYISSLNLPMFNDGDEDEDVDIGLVSQDLFPESHPPTSTRIEQLRELASDLES
ncbi:MAG: heat shock protein HtpX [Haloarculaceae archaeon]|jgi:heat shock protein HtpX